MRCLCGNLWVYLAVGIHHPRPEHGIPGFEFVAFVRCQVLWFVQSRSSDAHLAALNFIDKLCAISDIASGIIWSSSGFVAMTTRSSAKARAFILVPAKVYPDSSPLAALNRGSNAM